MTEAYDFIIVGGGSAGCVLANRLSASGEYQVCLIEAGPTDRNPLIRMPFGIAPLLRGSFCNWAFWSEPQTHLMDRRLYQPRGKVLGGSSAINGMVYTRGHPWDYDQWAAQGCDGWSFQELLPYFIRSESYQPSSSEVDAKFHGRSGPLTISARRWDNPVSLAFVQAAQQAGHQANPDFNGAQQEGVGLFKVFQKEGERCSNARAYLDGIKHRSNLHIKTDSRVTRVILRDHRAVGVRVLHKGTTQDWHARREIILSAGAFQSPQLLMLSGVGPREELARHHIPVLHELPGVGQNLQDHLDVFVEVSAKSRAPVSLHWRELPRLLRGMLSYWRRREGEFTSNAAEAGGFFKSHPDEPIPDLQWHLVPSANVKHGLNLAPLFKRYAYSVMIYDLRPLSRGHVGLQSADPMAPPLIDPNYAAEDRDIERLVRGIRETRRVLAQTALAPHHDVEIAPGPQLQSDAELRDYVRRSAEIAYHPAGTCKMGRSSDPLAVVDSRTRVLGLQGLRVVDASIMPSLPGSNTNAPVTMLAEKAADLILQDQGAGAHTHAQSQPVRTQAELA